MPKYEFARPINDNIISPFDSKVDIVIPFHGQYEKVTNLLESIFKHTRTNYYTVYLVDDASPNPTYINEVMTNVSKRNSEILKGIRCQTQRGFAGAMNAAYERSESPYLCFINSDCEIDDLNWLRSLGESLLALKSEGVRMIAPKTNNPVNGDPLQQGEKGKVVIDTILPDDSHLSMYCFMCHRELFARCGGFIKSYPFGYYEDEEFAARMKKYGHKQAVCGSTWIYHEGEATITNVLRDNPTAREEVKKNRERCIEDMKALKGKK